MWHLLQENQLTCQEDWQVLLFYRTGMPFYEKMESILNKAQSQYKLAVFYAIDADQFPGVCRRFGVSCVPQVLILQQGKEKRRLRTPKTLPLIQALSDICLS